MRKLSTRISIFLLVFAFIQAFSQEKSGPTYIGVADKVYEAPSLSSRQNLELAVDNNAEMKDSRYYKHNIIVGKDPQKTNDPLTLNPNPLTQKVPGKAPSLVFDAAASTSQPTDPALAVGPNHVIVVFNTGFRIFDKAGTALTGQLSVTNVFGVGGCCDLTASYDHIADRWVLTLLDTSNGVYVAVSKTNNPVTTTWTVYNYTAVTDYQKLSVWSDGYYMTDNTDYTNKVYAFERSKMLAGDPTAKILAFPLPGIVTSGFYSPQFLTLSDTNAPAPGNVPVVYMQDDAWGGITQDHIKMWNLTVDWANPTNSVMSTAAQLNTQPFISVFDGGSFTNLTQPNNGSNIDALQATIMNQAQFKKFSDHNSAVFNFVVDTDATTAEKAGIRWFELRQDGDGQPWSIYQEGTYTSPDGKHAWHGSLIMDVQGNIGMGYTAMGGTTNQFVSSYYTGRKAVDPLGTMSIAETLIAAGNGNIPGTRYGDYSKIDIDPSDYKTMWFINEYYNSGRKDVVGVFKIAPNYSNDVGVISIDTPVTGALTNSETVKVTLYNYGETAQTNFPVQLKVNGTVIATENYEGTLAASTSAPFTFAAKADLSTEGSTYTLEAATQLSGDQDTSNDPKTKQVTHKYQLDAGVTEITSPNSGPNLGNQSIVVKVENFGTSVLTNLPVSYTVDGGTAINETIAGPINPGAKVSYTFTTQSNFSAVKSFNVVARTNLTNDAIATNDEISKTITNSSCMLLNNSTVYPIGPNANTITTSVINNPMSFIVSDVNVKVNLTHTWDSDIDMKLIAPDGTQVILANDLGSSGDNYTNTIFDDQAAAAINTGTPPFTGIFKPQGSLTSLNGKQALGNWTLHINDDTNTDGGNLLNWSIDLCSNTYLANDEVILDSKDFLIYETSKNKFKTSIKDTNLSRNVDMTLFDMSGQLLLKKRLFKNGKNYETEFDMSYATKGVYIIKLTDGTTNYAKKFIVK